MGKTASKKSYLGMLVLIIVFSMLVVGCNPDDNDTVVDYGLFIRVGSGDIIYKNYDYTDEVKNLSGITWNDSSRTLTLNDFSFDTTYEIGLNFANGGAEPIKIILNGINTIKSAGAAIFALGHFLIEGNGSLTAIGIGNVPSHGFGGSVGISTSMGNITISNATVNAQGGDHGIRGYFSLESGNVTISGGNGAFSWGYTVPDGYKYWVSNTTTPSSVELIGNSTTTTIDSSIKWVRIQAP